MGSNRRKSSLILLTGLILSFAFLIPQASAKSPTGAELLRDSGSELIGYKLELERLGALKTEAGRSTFVSLVQRYCQGLEKVVPKNSPSEQEWLLHELRSDSPDRRTRGTLSVENARWRMDLLIDDCLRWVEVYEASEGGEDQYRAGKTGALIELGRKFGNHLYVAGELAQTLQIEELGAHVIVSREIMDLALFAAGQAAMSERAEHWRR